MWIEGQNDVFKGTAMLPCRIFPVVTSFSLSFTQGRSILSWHRRYQADASLWILYFFYKRLLNGNIKWRKIKCGLMTLLWIRDLARLSWQNIFNGNKSFNIVTNARIAWLLPLYLPEWFALIIEDTVCGLASVVEGKVLGLTFMTLYGPNFL